MDGVHPWSLRGHPQISASQTWISFAHMASSHWLNIGSNPPSLYPWPRHVANHLEPQTMYIPHLMAASSTGSSAKMRMKNGGQCSWSSLTEQYFNYLSQMQVVVWLKIQKYYINMQGSCVYGLVLGAFPGINPISPSKAQTILTTASIITCSNNPSSSIIMPSLTRQKLPPTKCCYDVIHVATTL